MEFILKEFLIKFFKFFLVKSSFMRIIIQVDIPPSNQLKWASALYEPIKKIIW